MNRNTLLCIGLLTAALCVVLLTVACLCTYQNYEVRALPGDAFSYEAGGPAATSESPWDGLWEEESGGWEAASSGAASFDNDAGDTDSDIIETQTGTGSRPASSGVVSRLSTPTPSSQDAPSKPPSSKAASSKPAPEKPSSSKPVSPEPAPSQPESSQTVPSAPETSRPSGSSEPAPEPPPSSSPPPDPPPSQPEPSKPEPGPPAVTDEENDAAADALAARWGVNVQIVREGEYPGASAPAADPVRLQTAIEEAVRALASFPDAFFEGTVSFVFVGRCASGGVVREGAAFLLPCDGTRFSAALARALLSLSAEAFAAEAGPPLAGLAPEGFQYGEPDPKYVYSSANKLHGWFLSLSAQQSESGELLGLFEALFQNAGLLESVSPESPLHAKVLLVCEAAADWRAAMRENHVVRYYLTGA